MKGRKGGQPIIQVDDNKVMDKRKSKLLIRTHLHVMFHFIFRFLDFK